jgi:RNA polymerase sigma factor (sigma-70 family)
MWSVLNKFSPLWLTEPVEDPATAAQEEFDGWYRALAPRIRGALTAMCGDSHIATDATSEAFARAYEHWSRVSRIANRDGWVYAVGVNVVRKQARRAALERRRATRWVERPAAAPEVPSELWRALGQLTTRQREAIALRYVADLTQQDVAAAMGIAPGTAAATLAQARQRLAELLGTPDTQEVDR